VGKTDRSNLLQRPLQSGLFMLLLRSFDLFLRWRFPILNGA
jgi:hypothetical protein